MKKWIHTRFSEPSTHAGLGLLANAALLFFGLDPILAASISGAVFGTSACVISEKK